MQLSLTQYQTFLIENSLNYYRSYIKELNMNNDKLLSTSKEWKEIDNIIQQIKGGN